MELIYIILAVVAVVIAYFVFLYYRGNGAVENMTASGSVEGMMVPAQAQAQQVQAQQVKAQQVKAQQPQQAQQAQEEHMDVYGDEEARDPTAIAQEASNAPENARNPERAFKPAPEAFEADIAAYEYDSGISDFASV